MGMGKTFDCAGVEKEFENMISAALDDFRAFNTNILNNPTPVSGDILINFGDFFEYVLEVRRNQKENSAISSVAAVVAAVAEQVEQQQQQDTAAIPSTSQAKENKKRR